MTIEIVDRQRTPKVRARAVLAVARRVASAAPRSRADSAAIVLAGDRLVRRLNRAYRGKDRTTDVLSFPAASGPEEAGRPLGEIVISVPQAARQAGARGHSVEREVALLVLHGWLHLLGYDHEVDDGTMAALEARLARRLFPGRRRG